MHNLRNKSNLLERMDYDSQKTLFEMIAKKMIVSRTMYRDRLRSIKNQQLPLLTITSSVSFKIISERKEITIITSTGEKKEKASEKHRYVIAKISKNRYLLPKQSQIVQSCPIKNSIRSPTEFLINFTGPT